MELFNNSLINILSRIYNAIRNIGTHTIYERYFATGDGSNTIFYLSNSPKSYIIILLNGVESNIDYQFSGNKITFANAPSSGVKISAIYNIGG